MDPDRWRSCTGLAGRRRHRLSPRPEHRSPRAGGGSAERRELIERTMATTLTDRTTTVDLDARRSEIVAQAEAAGLRLVRFLYCDNDGIIRGKSSGMSGLIDRLESGIGLTVAMQAFTLLDHLASVDGMGPVGEIRLVPDPTTFTVAPYAPHTGTVLVDMQTLDGQPYAADGRAFLKRMIARAAAQHDLALLAAFEPE